MTAEKLEPFLKYRNSVLMRNAIYFKFSTRLYFKIAWNGENYVMDIYLDWYKNYKTMQSTHRTLTRKTVEETLSAMSVSLDMIANFTDCGRFKLEEL